jgi:hypothetical protein
MEVRWLGEAIEELDRLPKLEQRAVLNVVRKLEVSGVRLGYPHSSAVRGAAHLRDLRPRAGRSPWRALYRRISDTFFIAAIAPETDVNPRAFERAIVAATERLAREET